MDHVEPTIGTRHSELSPRDTQRAINFLRAVWKLGACRTCGNATYELMAIAVQRMVSDMDILSDPASHRQPTASLTCSACGEVRFLDLSVARIVGAPDPRPAERGPSGGPFR